MKTSQKLIATLFFLVTFNLYHLIALAGPLTQNYQKTIYGHSEDCIDSNLGVKFHCNPNWVIQQNEDNLVVTISSYPEVTFTIEKTKLRIGFLSQLTQWSLNKMQRYAEGFGTERNTIANREALKVKAFSKENPRVRLSEYYLIHNLTLYRVVFSIQPKDEWDNYKFLIKMIMDSFNFV